MGITSVGSRFSILEKSVLALFAVLSFMLAVLAQQASNSFQQDLESSIAKEFTSQALEPEKDGKLRQTKTFFNPFVDPIST